MASGELGPVEPGHGVTKEAMLAQGLKMKPEEINQHVSDLMQGKGDPLKQASAVRTEEARLSQVSRHASLASELHPSDAGLRSRADNAFKDLTDFHNGPVAKLKANWHAQGMTLQGEIHTDLSSYNGLREEFLRNVGKAPDAKTEPVLRKTAKRVRDAVVAENASMQALGEEINKQSVRQKLPTPDQVRENIMKRMKVEPCPDLKFYGQMLSRSDPRHRRRACCDLEMGESERDRSWNVDRQSWRRNQHAFLCRPGQTRMDL